ncbi:U-box domain-containing protein 29-like [Durio zibethinus]|uniref:U-box domain-containing protein n=1 Tax=Durio zibethinus TaxID=66656 RepID=A0A6P5Z9R9_DURZI|nr:U-box domain-containing protein 29-like [Durio zibethinus]
MVKEELYITVPSFFRCPISLDIMKSPVSLCTGITYDRSSIQQWFDSGHDTCPATMQVLSSKDFVPNLTLHRLINLWVQSSTRRPGSDSPRLLQAAPTVISEVQAKLLIEKIESESCVDSLSKVAEFVSCCEENRRFVVGFGCFIEVIAGVLRRKCVEIEALVMAVKILDLILSENGVKKRLNKLILKSNQENNFFSTIIPILQNGSLDSKIISVQILDSLALDSESKQIIANSQNLISTLLHLLKTSNNNQSLNDAVISLLTTVSITRSVKSHLIQNGAVGFLSNFLTEKSLKLLAILCKCSQGRLAISSEPKCAAAIVEKLLKVSKTATEDAILVLWSMCCLSKDEKVKEEVVEGNGLTKILVVMQKEGEGNVKMMCRDLVKALRAGCKDWFLGSYETKTSHIRPYFYQMNSKSESQKAIRHMRNHEAKLIPRLKEAISPLYHSTARKDLQR